jgi:hypothetical protein
LDPEGRPEDTLTCSEVTVHVTQDLIVALAERIERAYRLRRPGWHGGCSTPRVWSVAAAVLLQVHESDPSVPPDPELFVASQPLRSPYSDPWVDLTRPESARYYRRRVRAIVRALRNELAGEVRHAEERIGAGQAIGQVLGAKNRKLSALGKFIVAHRAGRRVLAERFANEALEQHQACPLYRQACRELLPQGAYPAAEAGATIVPLNPPRRQRPQPHLN